MRKFVCLLLHHAKTTQAIIMKLCTHTLEGIRSNTDKFLFKKNLFFTKIEKKKLSTKSHNLATLTPSSIPIMKLKS